MFRSFNAKNLRSIGQRASKLLAVKFGGLKKKFAAQPYPLEPAGLDSRLLGVESFSKFGWW